MKSKWKKLVAVPVVAAVACGIAWPGGTASASTTVSVQINGVDVYSPYNYILNGTTYVDLEGYARLTNQTYTLNDKKTEATLRGVTFPIRVVNGLPTAPLRQIVTAGGAEHIFFDKSAGLTYVLDLPDGAIRNGTGGNGVDGEWSDAKSGQLGPYYLVEGGKLRAIEYRIPQEDLANGEEWTNANGMKGLPAPAVQSVDIALHEAGHHGMNVTHYGITHSFVPNPASNATQPAEEAADGKLVVLGDSISFGYGLEGSGDQPSSYAYPYKIDAFDYDVINLAQNGIATRGMLEKLEQANVQSNLASASIVVLNVGSNDLLHVGAAIAMKFVEKPDYVVTEEEIELLDDAIDGFRDRLALVVENVREHTDAPIVMLNYYNPFPASLEQTNRLHAFVEPYIAQLNEAAVAVAAEAGSSLALADVYAALNGRQATHIRIAAKDVHPSNVGQLAIATAVEKAIETLN